MGLSVQSAPGGGGGGATLGTEQTTTSGTTKDFTIPAGAKRIIVMFNGVSQSNAGGSNLGVQLGDSGGIETTGYLSAAAFSTTVTSATDRLMVARLAGSADTVHGSVMLSRINATHTWVAGGSLYDDAGTDGMVVCGGSKTLSAELTTVRVVVDNAFDAGSVNVLYE